MPTPNIFNTEIYSTREEYELITHKPCPVYDPTIPDKSWEILDIAGDDEGNYVYKSFNYETNTGNKIAYGTDGQPKVRTYRVPIDQAKKVNIPPRGPGILDHPNLKGEWPVPIKPLLAGQRYSTPSPFSLPIVVDTPIPGPAVITTGGNEEILQELKSIKNVLNIILNRLDELG